MTTLRPHPPPRLLGRLALRLLALAALTMAPLVAAAQGHDAEPGEVHAEAVADADEHGGGHGDESNIFAGDLGNILWTLVIFLLALVVLSKFAWKPLLGLLEERESFIRSALVEAKSDRESAEARLREYEEKLAGARAEATAIVEEGRRDAEATRARVEAEARAEADRMIARARREIDLARETAVRDLYDTSARLSTRIASRIVGRELDAKDHARLIESSIAEVGRLGETH
jgi:F-type H+-transporting ATPase subunit b